MRFTGRCESPTSSRRRCGERGKHAADANHTRELGERARPEGAVNVINGTDAAVHRRGNAAARHARARLPRRRLRQGGR